MTLTQKRLIEILDYDPETGIFRWKPKKQKGRVSRPDRIAGTPTKNGYVSIGVDFHKYLAHRLAWLYVHGDWPEHEIDHKNLNKSDNRIENLRQATKSQNKANIVGQKRRQQDCPKGVAFYERTGRYVAYITKNRKATNLGSFSTKEEARAAYEAAAKKEFGEFARTS